MDIFVPEIAKASDNTKAQSKGGAAATDEAKKDGAKDTKLQGRSPGESEANSDTRASANDNANVTMKVASNPEEIKKSVSKELVPLKVPDLFANMRVKNADSFTQYNKVRPANEPEVPKNYIKYIEPVFEEEQNTIEKCWTFAIKDYEVTEEKIEELKQHGI
jgi:hypothetical protein